MFPENFAEVFLDKLNTLSSTPSKTGKLAIISTFNDMERSLVADALNPSVSYYIAKLPPTSKFGTAKFGVRELNVLADLSLRRVTGDEALTRTKNTLEDLAPPDSEILRRVILKDLRCGIGAAMVNSVFPLTVPVFPYMRCSLPKDVKLESWPWSEGINAGLKMDGMFARCDTSEATAKFTTRQGNTFPPGFLKHLEDEAWAVFDDGTQTHGELTVWIEGKLQPRQIGNGLLNSVMQGGEIPKGCEVHFTVWDQIPTAYATPKGKFATCYSLRLARLVNQLLDRDRKFIGLVENRVVYSYPDALAYYKEVIARGDEGLILKRPDMVWEDKTSKSCVKLKLEVEVDLKVTGFNPGIPGKRTEATFGSLMCASECENLLVDVAGFTRDVENYLHNNRDIVIGKVVTVRANAIVNPSTSNPKYSLFHPRYIELRHDKVVADTIEQVKSQFEATALN